MRRNLSVFTAALLLAAALASPALADKKEGQAVLSSDKAADPGSYHDGSFYHVITGPGQNLGPFVTLSNPPQGWIYYDPLVIVNKSLQSSAPDTSFCYPAKGATKWAVFIYPTYDDSTAAVLFGLELRSHNIQAADSLTTYALNQRIVKAQPTSGASPQDTLGGSLTDFSGGNPLAATQTDERPLVMGPGPTPRGRGFMFDFVGDFISLRMRIISTYTRAGGSFVAAQVATTYRVDLYGYR